MITNTVVWSYVLCMWVQQWFHTKKNANIFQQKKLRVFSLYIFPMKCYAVWIVCKKPTPQTRKMKRITFDSAFLWPSVFAEPNVPPQWKKNIWKKGNDAEMDYYFFIWSFLWHCNRKPLSMCILVYIWVCIWAVSMKKQQQPTVVCYRCAGCSMRFILN